MAIEKIEKQYTLGEAAKVSGLSESEITKRLKEIGIDLAKRDPKRIKQSELDQITKSKGPKQP